MREGAVAALDADFARLAVARALMVGPVRPDRPLVEDRRVAERWVARFGAGPAGVEVRGERTSAGSLVVRPSGAAGARDDVRVVYLHGGGMVYYSAAVFAPFLQVLADEVGAPVECFDYAKAPEHAVGESVDDLARRVRERCHALAPRRLLLLGDSVGGLLGLHLALRVCPGAFERVGLLYPVLDLHGERGSYDEFGEGYFLDRDRMRLFRGLLRPALAERDLDPMHLTDADLARLGSPLVVTAGCDVLRDEGHAWVDGLRARGVAVEHQVFPALPHDFCLYAPRLPAARDAVRSIAAGLTRTLRTPAGDGGTTPGRTT